ncbi:unnamed protein product [Dibothriocephalus latus]|uniref:Uncharacterized protein n=1 Tax=Dibothriocephalus latus TaxID=60516 RepID=A0A3P7PUV8_DIBLA|nr:unnamed protein product [Dibothriocephalus latus]
MEFPIPDVKAALSEFVGSLEKRINNLTQGAFGNLMKNPTPGASADGRDVGVTVTEMDSVLISLTAGECVCEETDFRRVDLAPFFHVSRPRRRQMGVAAIANEVEVASASGITQLLMPNTKIRLVAKATAKQSHCTVRHSPS